MKKVILAFGTALILGSCGNGNSNTTDEALSDTTSLNMGNQAPMGDTANQINNRAGNFPADTSNQNGNDSIKGTAPASRSTTPGNESGKGGRKD